MKRRSFIKSAGLTCLGAAAGVGSSCSRTVRLEPTEVPFSFGDNYPKPTVGAITRRKLGATDIEVSSFGFGSHMRPWLVPYEKERERMLREAHEMGVNVFDVYDNVHDIFQYEPTGRHLKPVINDVVISIVMDPYGGRSLEEELHRDLKLFNRDYIDMVRIHAWAPDHPDHGDKWWMWEELFKFKEQGKIRAVGLPVHHWKDVEEPLRNFPLDFVIFPYNFYHSVAWDGHVPDKPFHSFSALLRTKGVGVVTMKPFCGDYLVTPLKDVASQYNPEISFPQASLRWIINSGIDADTTLAGMYYPSHVYENIDAYYNPAISDEEIALLDKVKKTAKTKAASWLPSHYQFLNSWAC